MTEKQFKALRLADELETVKLNARTSDAAAAELRRQYNEIERLRDRVRELEAREQAWVREP